MDGLRRKCEREGIQVHYTTITESRRVLGWFFRAPEGHPVIFLDKHLPTEPRLERCVFAEEVGHYVHLPISSPCGPYLSANLDSLYRSDRGRDERKAVTYAANYLIPTKKLARYAPRLEGLTINEVVHIVADEFYVTEWMAWRKLHIIRFDLKERQGLTVFAKELFAPVLVNCCGRLEDRRKAV